MIKTRLQIYRDEYKEVLRKNREMIDYYKKRGIGLNSDGVIEKRCDILYKIHKAEVKYLKMYHGNQYHRFEREYKKALFEYNNMAEQNIDERKLKAAGEKEKNFKKRLYSCLDKYIV
jgi:hypothetical protein